MTAAAVLPGSASGNCVDQLASSGGVTHFGELRIISSSTPGASYYGGIRFPTTPTMVNFRGAKLQLGALVNRNQINFKLRAHLHANSPAFTNSTRPKLRWDTAASVNFLDVHIPLVNAALAFEVPDPEQKIQAMIDEVMAVPGYASGNPITFLLEATPTIDFDCRLYPGTNTDIGPRLILQYGPLATDASEWQQSDMGDSLAAYLCHDGYEVASLPVIFMGTTTVGKAAAGMKNTEGLNMYGGDSFRGYETPATIERIMIGDFGEENMDIRRKEHAVAGTTLGQWYADISLTDGHGFWGSEFNSLNLRFHLKNPEKENQLIWLSAAGNDMHAWGKNNRLLSQEDGNVGADAVWHNYIFGTLKPELIAVIDHIYECVSLGDADPEKAWVILPGYPNFCCKKSNNAHPIIIPSSGSRLSNTQDTFRTVYSLQMSIGAAQFMYDSIGFAKNGELHDPWQNLSFQSALVRAAAYWQTHNHGEDVPPGYPYNPNGAWWDYALTQTGFPLPLGPLAYTQWEYGGVSRWGESWRNVHDITCNMRFRMLDAMYAEVADLYPHVIFVPSPQSMGIDSVYSADPSSPYAQSDPLDWVEGIHPNKEGFAKWLTNTNLDGTPSTMERVKWNVPWLQRFSEKIYHEVEEDRSLTPITNRGAFEGGVFDDIVPMYVDWPAMETL